MDMDTRTMATGTMMTTITNLTTTISMVLKPMVMDIMVMVTMINLSTGKFRSTETDTTPRDSIMWSFLARVTSTISTMSAPNITDKKKRDKKRDMYH